MKSTRSCRPTKKHRRSGVAIVEFALILPLLLGLSIAILQYGIIMNASNALNQIARESARYAATTPRQDAYIREVVKIQCARTTIQYTDLWDPTAAPPVQNIAIAPTNLNSRTPGAVITVTLTYPMSKKVFIPNHIKFDNPYPVHIRFFSDTVTQKGVSLIEGAASEASAMPTG